MKSTRELYSSLSVDASRIIPVQNGRHIFCYFILFRNWLQSNYTGQRVRDVRLQHEENKTWRNRSFDDLGCEAQVISVRVRPSIKATPLILSTTAFYFCWSISSVARRKNSFPVKRRKIPSTIKVHLLEVGRVRTLWCSLQSYVLRLSNFFHKTTEMYIFHLPLLEESSGLRAVIFPSIRLFKRD